MAAADDAYDRLHGLDGHTQATCPHDSEEVGTGASEGATGQDTGTAWVTRSADCPEAPAQAHLLGPDGFTPLVSDADYRAAFYRVMERCEELKTSVAEHQWNALEMARKADQAERRAEDAEAELERLKAAADYDMVRCPCGAPVGHADHCGSCCGGCGVASEHEHMATVEHLRRCPICDMRFTRGEDCDHDWLDRPESDSIVCDLCGEER